MTKPLSAEEMADTWARAKYEKKSKMPGREYTGAYLDGVEDFLAGHSSRDEEVRALRSLLEKAVSHIGGGILTQGVFREKLGGGTEYVRVDTYQGKLYQELKQALQPGLTWCPKCEARYDDDPASLKYCECRMVQPGREGDGKIPDASFLFEEREK